VVGACITWVRRACRGNLTGERRPPHTRRSGDHGMRTPPHVAHRLGRRSCGPGTAHLSRIQIAQRAVCEPSPHVQGCVGFGRVRRARIRGQPSAVRSRADERLPRRRVGPTALAVASSEGLEDEIVVDRAMHRTVCCHRQRDRGVDALFRFALGDPHAPLGL
jgi:hypothetical protein